MFLTRRISLVAIVVVLAGACSGEEGATISYTWSSPYPPELLAVRLGNERVAVKDRVIAPGSPNTLVMFAGAPPGSGVPLEVSLVAGLDTMVAAVTTVNLRKGQRFTLEIVAGPPPAGFLSSCAEHLAPIPIVGGSPADVLLVRWYQTDPEDLTGPC